MPVVRGTFIRVVGTYLSLRACIGIFCLNTPVAFYPHHHHSDQPNDRLSSLFRSFFLVPVHYTSVLVFYFLLYILFLFFFAIAFSLLYTDDCLMLSLFIICPHRPLFFFLSLAHFYLFIFFFFPSFFLTFKPSNEQRELPDTLLAWQMPSTLREFSFRFVSLLHTHTHYYLSSHDSYLYVPVFLSDGRDVLASFSLFYISSLFGALSNAIALSNAKNI